MTTWLIPPFVAWFIFCAWMGIRNFDRRRGTFGAKPAFNAVICLMLVGLGVAAVGVVTEIWWLLGLGAAVFIGASARHYLLPRNGQSRSTRP